MNNQKKISNALYCKDMQHFSHSLICYVNCNQSNTCSDSKKYEAELRLFLMTEYRLLFSGQMKLFKHSDIEKVHE